MHAHVCTHIHNYTHNHTYIRVSMILSFSHMSSPLSKDKASRWKVALKEMILQVSNCEGLLFWEKALCISY